MIFYLFISSELRGSTSLCATFVGFPGKSPSLNTPPTVPTLRFTPLYLYRKQVNPQANKRGVQFVVFHITSGVLQATSRSVKENERNAGG